MFANSRFIHGRRPPPSTTFAPPCATTAYSLLYFASFLQAEAVFTVGEAFRGDHKAALEALSSTTTLQFEYLDALLRPSQGSSPSAASLSQSAASAGEKEQRAGRRWGGTSSQGVNGRPSRAPPALAAGLDEKDRSLHIRLLVKFRPYEVYPFLSGSTGYVFLQDFVVIVALFLMDWT